LVLKICDDDLHGFYFHYIYFLKCSYILIPWLNLNLVIRSSLVVRSMSPSMLKLDEEQPNICWFSSGKWFCSCMFCRIWLGWHKRKQSCARAGEKCNKYDLTATPCFWLADHDDWSKWFGTPPPVCSVSFSFMCRVAKKVNNLNLDVENIFAGSRTQQRSLQRCILNHILRLIVVVVVICDSTLPKLSQLTMISCIGHAL
jgi:hypothetical protein